MPEYPYMDVDGGKLTFHITSFEKVTLNTFQAKIIFNLLQGFLEQGVKLNSGQWNGAVAILENLDAVPNWPKVIEQYGGFDVAIHRAKSIHEKKGVPTVAYALLESFGVKKDEMPLTDEDSIEDEDSTEIEQYCIESPKRMITLEDFV